MYTPNKRRRFLAMMLALTLSLSLLTACGDEEATETPEPETSKTEVLEPEKAEGTSAEQLLQQKKEPAPVVEKVAEENHTKVVEGMGNGLEPTVGGGVMDPNPNRTITRSTASVPQIRSTDIYGNPLGDEFYFYRNQLSDIEKKPMINFTSQPLSVKLRWICP